MTGPLPPYLMVLMTAPSPPPPLIRRSGSATVLHVWLCAHVPKLGTHRNKTNEWEKNILQFRVGGYFTFHLLPGFLGCSGVSRTVLVFPVLVHADSLDEVLRCDYSKYFSLLDSNCTLGCLFLCILRKKKSIFALDLILRTLNCFACFC